MVTAAMAALSIHILIHFCLVHEYQSAAPVRYHLPVSKKGGVRQGKGPCLGAGSEDTPVPAPQPAAAGRRAGPAHGHPAQPCLLWSRPDTKQHLPSEPQLGLQLGGGSPGKKHPGVSQYPGCVRAEQVPGRQDNEGTKELKFL